MSQHKERNGNAQHADQRVKSFSRGNLFLAEFAVYHVESRRQDFPRNCEFKELQCATPESSAVLILPLFFKPL